MKYKQYSRVKLKDGRICTITDVLGDGESYAVETDGRDEPEVDLITNDEIEGDAAT